MHGQSKFNQPFLRSPGSMYQADTYSKALHTPRHNRANTDAPSAYNVASFCHGFSRLRPRNESVRSPNGSCAESGIIGGAPPHSGASSDYFLQRDYDEEEGHGAKMA